MILILEFIQAFYPKDLLFFNKKYCCTDLLPTNRNHQTFPFQVILKRIFLLNNFNESECFQSFLYIYAAYLKF